MKNHGSYNKSPMHLERNFSFICKFPQLLQNFATQSITFPPKIKKMLLKQSLTGMDVIRKQIGQRVSCMVSTTHGYVNFVLRLSFFWRHFAFDYYTEKNWADEVWRNSKGFYYFRWRKHDQPLFIHLARLTLFNVIIHVKVKFCHKGNKKLTFVTELYFYMNDVVKFYQALYFFNL